MRRWYGPAVAGAIVAVLLAPANARAQAASGTREPEPPPKDYGWSVGLGAGMVLPEEGSETYWSLNVRRSVRARSAESASRPPEGLKALVEGEVGYWKGGSAAFRDKDLLVGMNIIGVVPTRSLDLFIGVGFAAHFVDNTLIQDAGRSTTSETRFGGNIQFGLEVRATARMGVFGIGRVDFLSGDNNRQLSKVWGGLRFRF